MGILTPEEKMLWASLFSASFVKDGCVDEALWQAGEGISVFRRKLHVAKLTNSVEDLGNAKEMVGE